MTRSGSRPATGRARPAGVATTTPIEMRSACTSAERLLYYALVGAIEAGLVRTAEDALTRTYWPTTTSLICITGLRSV